MYDIIIIGAGPAGISMAVEAIEAGIKTEKILILEKADEHSFTIKKYYPDSKLVTANYKGFEARCTGVMCLSDSTKQQTISYLDKAIQDYSIHVEYRETVHKILSKNKEQKFVLVTDKNTYESKVVVVAVGILGKPNKPDYKLPSTLNSKIFFDVTSAEIFNSKVLVVGGGDSASEYCQYLVQKNNNVTLSYRQSDFKRMNEINQKSINTLFDEKKLTVYLNSNIVSVIDEQGSPKVNFVERQSEIFDYVIYALGGSTPENFLKLIGIEFDGPEPILKEGYETTVPALFLTGDLSAGKKGGSIIWAFNSSKTAIKKICSNYLGCKESF
ncbi:MAG: NAD(P)-binding domain-containing protein [Ignavibacteriaceae bacterium]|nr:NAD(P)-binding domain-containing protein [Ignavibacteriaceae bacterium]